MHTTTHLAKHLRQVYFGGNWSDSNLKDNLADLTWEEANTQVYSLNSILKLTYHITYYVDVVQEVFLGKPLNAKDKWSFEHPSVESEEDWRKVQEKAWDDVEKLAKLIESLPEDKLWSDFHDPKYGNYFSNMTGIIEHLHYHLGQIAIIKKIIRQQ